MEVSNRQDVCAYYMQVWIATCVFGLLISLAFLSGSSDVVAESIASIILRIEAVFCFIFPLFTLALGIIVRSRAQQSVWSHFRFPALFYILLHLLYFYVVCLPPTLLVSFVWWEETHAISFFVLWFSFSLVIPCVVGILVWIFDRLFGRNVKLS